MKRLMLVIMALVSLNQLSFGQVTTPRNQQTVPRYEFGVFLGQPIGLSGKYWFNSMNAVDLLAAWSFSGNGIFELDADYLLHYYYPKVSVGTLPLYIGIGAGFRIGHDWFIGARFPIGAEYLFSGLPLAVFAEIDPQWQFIPDNKFALGAGIGVRVAIGTAPNKRYGR